MKIIDKFFIFFFALIFVGCTILIARGYTKYEVMKATVVIQHRYDKCLHEETHTPEFTEGLFESEEEEIVKHELWDTLQCYPFTAHTMTKPMIVKTKEDMEIKRFEKGYGDGGGYLIMGSEHRIEYICHDSYQAS